LLAGKGASFCNLDQKAGKGGFQGKEELYNGGAEIKLKTAGMVQFRDDNGKNSRGIGLGRTSPLRGKPKKNKGGRESRT